MDEAFVFAPAEGRSSATEPKLVTTGVGSLPHLSAEEAVADVLAFCPEYPFWPQLPRFSAREDMYRQFSAALPGLSGTGLGAGADAGLGAGASRQAEARADAPRWRRDAAAEEDLQNVYADALALAEGRAAPEEVLARWVIAAEDARGLYALREALATGSGAGGGPRGVKGQVTGPVSLGLAVADEGGRALLYEEDLMDGVARGLALRARWQERMLRELSPDTIISVDEPYLGTFGSAYFPYRPETVLGYLRVFDETLDGVWGVHCCANTDWEFVLSSPARYLSFDAYAFGDRLILYPRAVKSFLAAGKIIAWGIVPTAAEALGDESPESLAGRLTGYFETLASRGVPERALARQSMVTPACGLAGLPVDGARRAMGLARAVSDAMRQDFAEYLG